MKNRIKNIATSQVLNKSQVDNASQRAIWLRTTNLDDMQGLRRTSNSVDNTIQTGKPPPQVSE